MTLKDIVTSKPAKMVSCRTDCGLAQAITLMESDSVGSVLVMDDDDRLVGIFTQQDIMHCLEKQIPIHDTVIGSVMTTSPLTLDGSVDISVAVSLMSEKKIRHLPITENGQIIGVISYRDLISYLLPEILFME